MVSGRQSWGAPHKVYWYFNSKSNCLTSPSTTVVPGGRKAVWRTQIPAGRQCWWSRCWMFPSFTRWPGADVGVSCSPIKVQEARWRHIAFLIANIFFPIFCSSWETANFQLDAFHQMLRTRSFSTLHFLLFVNFSPHVKHTGNLSSLAVKANDYPSRSHLFMFYWLFFWGFIQW